MKLDKAIEILMKQRFSFPTDEMRVINDALKLGIEALKVIKDVRPTDYGAIDDLLPGETK